MAEKAQKEGGLVGVFNRQASRMGWWCMGSLGVWAGAAALMVAGLATPWITVPLLAASGLSAAYSGFSYASNKAVAGALPFAKAVSGVIPHPKAQLVSWALTAGDKVADAVSGTAEAPKAKTPELAL